jgi:hypothetical protein
MPKKYVINPNTGKPIELYGKLWDSLIKRNILKNKIVNASVIQFDNNETPEVLEKMKRAMPKKDGSFVTRYKNKLITKNAKLTNEQLINYVIDNYPAMLEKVLDTITDEDTDEQIKEKFSNILHLKLLS